MHPADVVIAAGKCEAIRVVAWRLLLLVPLAAPGAILGADGEATHVQPNRTAKERLGGMPNDSQFAAQPRHVHLPTLD